MSILRYPDAIWSLPLLFNKNDDLTNNIIQCYKDLDENYNFINFGTFRCKWSGGRPSRIRNYDVESTVNYLTKVREKGITPAFTFSNYHVSQKDLNDKFCNEILDAAVKLNCQFIISSDLLHDYIKKLYPEAYCTCSVIKPYFELENPDDRETEFYNRMLDKFDRVVARPEYVKYKIREEAHLLNDIERIEILLNQTCLPNCPFAAKHYTAIEKAEYTDSEDFDVDFQCPRMGQSIQEKTKHNVMLSVDELDFMVNELKIRHLKLQGRDFNKKMVLFLLISYMFEPVGDAQFTLMNLLSECSI